MTVLGRKEDKRIVLCSLTSKRYFKNWSPISPQSIYLNIHVCYFSPSHCSFWSFLFLNVESFSTYFLYNINVLPVFSLLVLPLRCLSRVSPPSLTIPIQSMSSSVILCSCNYHSFKSYWRQLKELKGLHRIYSEIKITPLEHFFVVACSDEVAELRGNANGKQGCLILWDSRNSVVFYLLTFST